MLSSAWRISLFGFAIAVLAGPARAIDTGAPQHYITGSWVNVRSAPAPDAPVLGRLVVNTPVRLLGSRGDNGFCEVNYAPDKTGHVACRFIGDEPVWLTIVGAQFDQGGQPNPAYSAPKAFWLQPNVDRLLAAGKHFETTMLKPGEAATEQKTAQEAGRLGKIRRFAIPEFEAMKDRLKNGVTGSRADDPDGRFRPLASWKSIKQIAMRNPSASDLSPEGGSITELHSYWGWREVPVALIRALELPTVGNSHFRDAGQLLPPSVTTEVASWKFGIPYRAVVKGGPKWIQPGHYNDGYLFGAWDVGAVETTLVSDVRDHDLNRDGSLRSKPSRVPGGRFPDTDADGEDCKLGFAWGDAGAEVNRAVFGPAARPPTGNRLFHFFSRDDLPRDKASVVRGRSKFTAAGFVSAETLSFDLDGDGVADFLVWEGTGISQQDIHDPGSAQANYRIVFVNIAGEWRLFLVDEFLYGCGC